MTEQPNDPGSALPIRGPISNQAIAIARSLWHADHGTDRALLERVAAGLSVASEVDGEDLDDRVRITPVPFRGRIAVLVVDTARTADFVVDGARVALPLRAVVLTTKHGRGADRRWSARSGRHMLPELPSRSDTHTVGQAVPYVEVLPVHQDAVGGFRGWPSAGCARGHEWPVRSGLRVLFRRHRSAAERRPRCNRIPRPARCARRGAVDPASPRRWSPTRVGPLGGDWDLRKSQ